VLHIIPILLQQGLEAGIVVDVEALRHGDDHVGPVPRSPSCDRVKYGMRVAPHPPKRPGKPGGGEAESSRVQGGHEGVL
jgi:hypothetical protein